MLLNISVILLLSGFTHIAEATGVSENKSISQMEQRAYINTWLAQKLSELPKSKESIYSKVLPHLGDRDRVEFRKVIEAWSKADKKDRPSFYVIFDSLAKRGLGGVTTIKMHPSKEHVAVVSERIELSYDPKNIWQSLNGSVERQKKKSAFLWLEFFLRTAHANSQRDRQYILKGLNEDLLVVIGAQEALSPPVAFRGLAQELEEAGLVGEEPGFIRRMLGGATEKELTCSARGESLPPTVSGTMQIMDKDREFRYENNVFTVIGDDGQELQVELGRLSEEEYQKGKESCFTDALEGKYRDLDRPLSTALDRFGSTLKETMEARGREVDSSVQSISSSNKSNILTMQHLHQLHELHQYLRWFLRHEQYRIDGMRDRQSVSINPRLEDMFDTMMEECGQVHNLSGQIRSQGPNNAVLESLGFQGTNRGTGGELYGLRGQLAQVEGGLARLNSNTSEMDRLNGQREKLMEEFKEANSLPDVLDFKPETIELSDLPSGINIGNKALSEYQESLASAHLAIIAHRNQQTAEREALLQRAADINAQIDQRLADTKNQLMERAVLAAALSGCCANNHCNSSLWSRFRLSVVPPVDGSTEAVR